MASAINMPQLGESVTEGTVGKWLKQVGESVEKYEPLLEVISDKVDTEITATEPGVLLSIEVEEGETVPVGTVLCYIGQEGETVGQGGDDETAAPAAEEPSVTPEEAVLPPNPQAPVAMEEEEVEASNDATQTAAAEVEEGEGEEDEGGEPESSGSARTLTPVVARMVAEHNLDLSQIKGSGRDGRISKRDIEDYLEGQEQTPAAAAAPTPPAQPPTSKPSAAPAPAAPPVPAPAARVAPPAPAPAPKAAPAPMGALGAQPGELIPLNNMRRRIAEHMVSSKRNAPHVTTVFEADLSAISGHRDANRREFEGRGVRLTFMAYFVEAVARALRAHPLANSTFTENGIQLYRDVNIGMAAATRGGAGLLVPVVRNADEKNLLGLARDVDDLTQRARSNGLTPDDMSGGTFTITNHGVGGSLWGTPIINQPQSAILGLGKIQKRVVVTKDDAIAIRPMVYLSFTFDHRVLDGATADAFMTDLVDFIENYRG